MIIMYLYRFAMNKSCSIRSVKYAFFFSSKVYIVTFTDMMHLEVESAGVADSITMLVASPESRDVRLAVGTRRASSPRCSLQQNYATLSREIFFIF